MSFLSPELVPRIPSRTVSLEGIGAESAITIQRAVDHYADAVPDGVREATGMVLRHEIRESIPSGEDLLTGMAPDEAAIMKEVAQREVLGKAETAYADEKYYEVAAPESPIVPRSVAKYMARSLRTMQLASEGPDQLSAAEALKSLQRIEAMRKPARMPKSQMRWAGWQLVRTRVPRVG